ncbi:acetoacetyl-CoA synthetase [Halobacillus andaensis]|uniref:Acetoacetyl-CoA synthetase n=1 Tax=Halobacillus andaensis TaxID=1176239 RepID=A0A917B7Y9_HALAA|nr:acetoacetate--CoA ligase [Halobacillus andaensis]MBP2006438.1 acetoacetyl-CoA synthetase [Halobacillus andaensis]GGF27394.1 acetoacetyl-CoA synthetase [Halobacillus andaensis]
MTILTTPKRSSFLWEPSKERIENSHIKAFADFTDQPLFPYERLHLWSTSHLGDFWSSVWDYAGVIGDKGDQAYVPSFSMPDAEWFPNARLNFAENLLRGSLDRIAAYEASETGVHHSITLRELKMEVAKAQQGLKDLGVQKGDCVAGITTNNIQGLVALIATASLGAIWTSCSPDFGTKGIVDRIGQVRPKVLIATLAYQYKEKPFHIEKKIQETTENLEGLSAVITLNGEADLPGIKTQTWEELCANDADVPDFTQTAFNDPLYILYTSGTTGLPKAIVHSVGGTLLQHVKEHQLHCDVQQDDVLFWYTNTAWMMYPWLVSGLASEAALLLYDGSPVQSDNLPHLWDVADEVGVTHFGTSPKYLETLAKADVQLKNTHSLTTLKSILSCGAPLAPEQYDWVYETLKEDLLLASISGGTEIIGCFVMGSPVHPVKRGEIACKALGMAVDVLDERGASVYKEKADLVCTQPFPSMPITFLGEGGDERYRNSYFSKRPGIWTHGDLAEQTIEEAFIIYGRADTTLNPGGVRIGTAEIYRVVEHVQEVEDSVVFGLPKDHDEEIVLCVVTKHFNEELAKNIRRQIRSQASPRHVPKRIYQVDEIPHTINGKKVEGAAKTAALGDFVKNEASLRNPSSLQSFRQLTEKEYL